VVDFAISTFVTLFICMACFRLSALMVRTLGWTGNAVLSRLPGILLAAYSVQFVLDGIAAVRTTNP
jgi:multiple antibiotic resistance protein